MKIATHDSATGEKSKNWLHTLGKIFAQTQTKTIREQYEAGCRYFDLRVDKDLVLCHGLWKSKKTLRDILIEMREYVTEIVYVAVTIEREYPECMMRDIFTRIEFELNLRPMVKKVYIARKKPKLEVLVAYRIIQVKAAYLSVPTPKQYLTFAFKDWRRYIPIPWLLKKITPKIDYNEDCFTMLDFI